MTKIKGPGIFLAQFLRDEAPFIARHIIETTDVTFDDFAGAQTDLQRNRKILGLD